MPRYDPLIHHRRSIWLKGFDYTQPGAFFVTLVTKNREMFFGEITEGIMHLNTYGQIVNTFLQRLQDIFPYIALDTWVVMPNHIHAVLWIVREESQSDDNQLVFAKLNTVKFDEQKPNHPKGAQPKSLGAIIGNYKLTTARRINRIRKSPGESLWQRDFYDDIIRNQRHLEAVRQYISENPANWQYDAEYPIA